jgi:hypothetical protein
MANFTSATRDAEVNAANKSDFASNALTTSGDLKVKEISYTVGGAALTSSDSVNLGSIPAGYAVVPALSSISVVAASGNGVVELGDGTDADKFAAGLTVAAAGAKPLGTNAAVKADVATALTLTLASGTVTSGAVLRFSVVLAK